MKKYFKYLSQALLTLVAAVAISACSSDDPEPTPDPVVPTDIQGAHFDESNVTNAILFASETNRSVEYTLTRNTVDGALTVPVKVISATEGLNVPANVTFSNGSTTATYVVTAPEGAKEGDSFNFEVELEGADQYAEAGATRFSATISFPYKHYARMWWTGFEKEYGYFLNEVYELDGSYVFPNFLQSGTEVTVRYDKTATVTHECDVMTSPSLQSADESNPGCYYLYCWKELEDNEDGEWTAYYPHGKDARVMVEYMTMYVSHDGYQATVYNPEAKSGWIQISEVSFYDKEKDASTELFWQFLNWVVVDDPENDGFDYTEPDPIVIDTDAEAQFVGTWTFIGTDPYCDDPALTPAATYQIVITQEGDELQMNGLAGISMGADGESESYYTGVYDAENQTIEFINGSRANGGYTWDSSTENWYYTYNVTLNVSTDEQGNLVLSRDKIWHFYALGDDWFDASYATMKFVKNK